MKKLKPLPRITDEQYIGLTKLMNWCIQRERNTKSKSNREMWKDNIKFLAELRRGQFYTEEQKERYNKIREHYYIVHKKIKL